MSTENRQDRLREHPTERFASAEREIDLDACFDDLLDEPHEAIDGHRQITIFHQASLTLTLFYFQEGGHLPEHVVDGPVTIQVLDGDLEVSTSEADHRLSAGQLLVLAPGVEHDVKAHAESRMLLTVRVA
ncbi:MAG: cupin domain-containing protein [Persicimonas sp.]